MSRLAADVLTAASVSADRADGMVTDVESFPGVALVLTSAAAVGLLAAFVLHRVVRRIGRRSPAAADLARRGRWPARLGLMLLMLLAALNVLPDQSWTPVALRVVGLLTIATIAWMAAVLTYVAEDLALARYRVDVDDNLAARRVHTQVTMLRRVAVAVIAVIGVAVMLMTFPSVRVAGAGIVASAGVVSIVVGLAAQTALSNVFAGMQLAFTDAIRVDDVVVVEGEWGRIEEITLTYVVVRIWDERRLILPSTYFTTTPFQNWTRRESAVLGTVEMDLDWQVPVEDMRAELHRILDRADLWDGRVAVLQVTEATGANVRVRALVSGKDGPTVWDLRCQVREALVGWLQREHPAALPRVRIESKAASNGHRSAEKWPEVPEPGSDDHHDHDDHGRAKPSVAGRSERYRSPPVSTQPVSTQSVASRVDRDPASRVARDPATGPDTE